MQVGALTVGQSSNLVGMMLIASGVSVAAATEEEVCAAPEETTGDDISPLQLVVVLIVFGAIIGALGQYAIVAWLFNKRVTTCEAAVQTEIEVKMTPLQANRGQQTVPIYVHDYWAQPLHKVRAEALKRGVPDAATSTRMALAGVLIHVDLTTVR